VGDAETVYAVVPGAGVEGHHAQPHLTDVAHVVLVIEVEAGDGELEALGGGEVDSEAVRATVAVERAAAAEGVVSGGEEAEVGGAEVVADESNEALPAGLAEGGGADAAVFDALEEGVEAPDGTAAAAIILQRGSSAYIWHARAWSRVWGANPGPGCGWARPAPGSRVCFSRPGPGRSRVCGRVGLGVAVAPHVHVGFDQSTIKQITILAYSASTYDEMSDSTM
jgi:hypothetical protein